MLALEKDKTACFTGHRPQKLPYGFDETDERCRQLKRQLSKEVYDAIQSGYDTFLSGMALGTDIWCSEAVIPYMEDHGIRLIAVIPHEGQELQWSKAYIARYNKILDCCSDSVILRKEYSPDCMMERNRYMVDYSSRVIAVFNGSPGGSAYTLRYAHDKGAHIILLDPNTMTKRIID